MNFPVYQSFRRQYVQNLAGLDRRCDRQRLPIGGDIEPADGQEAL
jgi:hypothetical protein